MHAHEAFFASHGQPIVYEKGQRFIRTDDPNDHVYFLRDGLLKVSFTVAAGEERLIGYVLPGAAFGQLRSFYELDGGTSDYSTVLRSVVYRIHQADYVAGIAADSDLTQELIELLFRNQNFLIERLVYQGETYIEERMLRWLLFMTRYFGEETPEGTRIFVPLTHEEIGSFLHASRASISQALGNLTRKGLVSIAKKHVTVPDLEKVQGALGVGREARIAGQRASSAIVEQASGPGRRR